MEQRVNFDKRYYSNATGIEVTNIDIKLLVNYKNQSGTEPLCEIIFSPEQAKLTMLMLEKAISEFEKNNREINSNADSITKIKGE